MLTFGLGILVLGSGLRLKVIWIRNKLIFSLSITLTQMKTLLPEDIRKGAGFSSQKRKISKTEKQPTSSMKAKRILGENNAGLPEPKPSLDVGTTTVVKPIIKSENKLKG
jgi:hypothetical protein